jgi:hypothetical protein
MGEDKRQTQFQERMKAMLTTMGKHDIEARVSRLNVCVITNYGDCCLPLSAIGSLPPGRFHFHSDRRRTR